MEENKSDEGVVLGISVVTGFDVVVTTGFKLVLGGGAEVVKFDSDTGAVLLEKALGLDPMIMRIIQKREGLI